MQMNKPKTYEEAIKVVYSSFRENEMESPAFHFSGGMNIRNNLGLWDKESPLHKHMLERFGLCHADDTGTLIWRAALAESKGEAYDPMVDVERFKKHWLNMGLDPATMEYIK